MYISTEEFVRQQQRGKESAVHADRNKTELQCSTQVVQDQQSQSQQGRHLTWMADPLFTISGFLTRGMRTVVTRFSGTGGSVSNRAGRSMGVCSLPVAHVPPHVLE